MRDPIAHDLANKAVLITGASTRIGAAAARAFAEAGAPLFLASPTLSGCLTGQILEINGGQVMP